MVDINPLVLAAGQGTRMNSDIPKVLHETFGEPMLTHVLRSLERSDVRSPHVVLGSGREQVRSKIESEYEEVIQEEQLGTGHAVKKVLNSTNFSNDSHLLVTCGDIPGLKPSLLNRFADAYMDSSAELMLMITEVEDPEGYGRVKLDDRQQSVQKIVEHSDATEEEKAIRRINTGVLCGKVGMMDDYLSQLNPDNEQGELYLTDVVELARDDGHPVDYFKAEDTWQVRGINTRRELVDFERKGYRRRADRLIDKGVTIRDPDMIKIGPWVDIARDVELQGSVSLLGNSKINTGTEIRGDCYIFHTEIGTDSFVESSTIKFSKLGADVQVGPYTHVRPDCDISEGVRLGNFVEIKKTSVGKNSNISHLSYVGNSEIGQNVNVGAGTITCNYDGEDKYKTLIEDDVFIGSNVEIVAPVTISSDATIGAGSTITKDVPSGSLGIGRERQENIPEWD